MSRLENNLQVYNRMVFQMEEVETIAISIAWNGTTTSWMCREFSIGFEPPNNFATLPFLLLIKETSNATESCYVPGAGKFVFRNIHCNLDTLQKIY